MYLIVVPNMKKIQPAIMEEWARMARQTGRLTNWALSYTQFLGRAENNEKKELLNWVSQKVKPRNQIGIA